jgi:hypothetical protein
MQRDPRGTISSYGGVILAWIVTMSLLTNPLPIISRAFWTPHTARRQWGSGVCGFGLLIDAGLGQFRQLLVHLLFFVQRLLKQADALIET